MSPSSAIAAQIAQQQLFSSKRMQALTLLCRVYIGTVLQSVPFFIGRRKSYGYEYMSLSNLSSIYRHIP